jgi:hypothetical protein
MQHYVATGVAVVALLVLGRGVWSWFVSPERKRLRRHEQEVAGRLRKVLVEAAPSFHIWPVKPQESGEGHLIECALSQVHNPWLVVDIDMRRVNGQVAIKVRGRDPYWYEGFPEDGQLELAEERLRELVAGYTER